MHFVSFPALTEAERIDGLAPIDPSHVPNNPAAAVDASGIKDATRVRLLQRSDGPVYIVTGRSGVRAVRGDDLTDAGKIRATGADDRRSSGAAARTRHCHSQRVVEFANYDQWTVPNGFDRHRPLYRVALNDDAGTEFYVSSVTGEVVLDTTRRERAWNYVGSVAHWIYPTLLRKSHGAWDATVWWLSLVALIAAISGSILGIVRMKIGDRRIVSPYSGWQKWHHVLGLVCMIFVLTWIFSGWLSMDHGRLFSTGKLSAAETAAIAGTPAWESIRRMGRSPISAATPGKLNGLCSMGNSTDATEPASTRSTWFPLIPAFGSSPQREFLDPAEVARSSGGWHPVAAFP